VDFTDDLLGGIPGQVLSTLVENKNIPLHVGGDDPVDGAGNQILEEFVGRPEIVSGSFLVGKIANVGVGAICAVGRRCEGDTEFDVPDLAGGGSNLYLRTGFITVLFGMRKDVFHQRLVFAAEEIGDGHPQYPGVLMAGDLRDRAIGILYPHPVIEDQYPIICQFNNGLQHLQPAREGEKSYPFIRVWDGATIRPFQ
jgi:hypothetical protein